MIFPMKRAFFFRTLAFTIVASALILASCSTTETRISGHPEIYQTLSPRDQTLVSQGQIRAGMSQNAVWLAWGSPDRKIVGNMRGRPTETWIYVNYTTAPYGYGYPYGPYRSVMVTVSDLPASVLWAATIIMAAGLSCSLAIPSSIHSIIPTFRRAFRIRPRRSPSETDGSCRSNTWCHRTAD